MKEWMNGGNGEMMLEYNTPFEIEKRSFEIIDAGVGEQSLYNVEQWPIVRRMIHTSADFELVGLVKFHPQAISSGIEALKKGCLIITDTKMACCGIRKAQIEKFKSRVETYIDRQEVILKAKQFETTRAKAAVDFALPFMDGAIIVVGNAPTALIRVVELIEEDKVCPSLIIGMPVGFVNVVEAKEMLCAQNKVPYITVAGRKGGTPLACAVVNQLAVMADGG